MAIRKWLHISDLHLNTTEVESVRMREQLPDYLLRNGIKYDYIFCTGDIRDSSGEHYKEPFPSIDFLKQLCEIWNLSTEKLFIVPGNHDVNRSAADRINIVRKMLWEDKKTWRRNYKPEIGNIDKETLSNLYEGQSDFRKFLQGIYNPERLKYYQNSQRPHFNIETEEFNILHIDSTLAYSEEQQDNLIVGTAALYQALKNLNEQKPTILLSHYAMNMLDTEESRQVANMLRDKHISLWLGGHEHYHELKSYGYIHSVQAGEIKIEERCSATILVGEYDTQTGHGFIKAYTWFSPLGWAENPIIWRGFMDDEQIEMNKYPFYLTTSVNRGREYDVIAAEKENKMFEDRIPENILNDFFADVACEGEIYKDKNPILALLEKGDNYALLGDGGMGKTTMMLSACRDLTSQGRTALYIPLEQIEAYGTNIENRIVEILYSGDRDKFINMTKKKSHISELILFLDGMNEIISERELTTEIKKFARMTGIQIIISSRSSFTEKYGMNNFKEAVLQPLREEQLQMVFDEEEWKNIEKNYTLRQLIKNPMLASMYKQIYPIMNRHRDCSFLQWIEPIKNVTQLLKNYYIAQMAILLERSEIDGEKILKSYTALNWILPNIAFEYEKKNRFHVSIDELEMYVEAGLNNISKDSVTKEIQREYRIRKTPDFNEFDMEDYLLTESHLLKRIDDRVYFHHQIYRDYLSAKYIEEETTIENVDAIWNQRKIPYAVSCYIAEMSEHHWSATAQIVAVDARGKRENEKYNQILNLVTIFDCDNADYTELDLSRVRLLRQKDGRIKLRGAILSDYSIGCENGMMKQYQSFQFSGDNEWLAGMAGAEMTLWNVNTGATEGRWKLKGFPQNMSFVGKYLLVYIKSERISGIEIFEFSNEKWKENGLIKGKFNERLRKIIFDEDEFIHIYYNNREYRYRIFDGKCIYNERKKRAYEDICNGYDLTFIQTRMKKVTGNEEIFSQASSSDGQLQVNCYKDGRVNICYPGGQVKHVLDVKRTALYDAAISDNGMHAVTLSYDVYDGKRKIQLWDLEKRQKIEERFCSENTISIHLVEMGEWILGKEENRVWCWNWNDKKRFCYLMGELLSNQQQKVTSYGNKILRKNDVQKIELFDLDTEESEILKDSRKEIKYAAIMQNGELAIVDARANYVYFNSIRSGKELKVNSEPGKILGIFQFKQEPFIAVATTNSVVSMYHIGTGQRTRILKPEAGCRIMTGYTKKMAVACAGNRNQITVLRYFSWDEGRKGRWYPAAPKFSLTGKVLDLAFNAENEELVAITTTGQIYYMSDLFCDYNSRTQVINGFNVEAYDFTGVVCSDEVKEQLKGNGAIGL